MILMGSAAETARETVDYLTARGEKVGLINVHLYRPFSAEHLLSAIPQTCRKIAVLDRTKEPGAMGEPLYQDVCTVYQSSGIPMTIVGGRYGLSSKDTTPGQILAVYENLKQEKPKRDFTIGIVDDVTHTSLPVTEIETSPAGQTSAEFWGMGSDGTVGANKNSIKIIGHATDLYCQAYFVYDSKEIRRSDPEPPTVRKNAHPISLSDHQGGLCCLPQPLLRPQVRHGEQSEGGRHLPAELPLGRGRGWSGICPPL